LIENPRHALLEDFIGPPSGLAPVAGGHGRLDLLHGPPQDLRLSALLSAQGRPAAE
jgi:hypothetical protein